MKLKYKDSDNSSFQKGNNLLALFDLSSDCNVLIIGNRLSKWQNKFLNADFYQSYPAITSFKDVYDLVLFDSRDIKSSKNLPQLLKKLRLILSPMGTLIIFAYNFWSFSNLKHIVKGRRAEFFGKMLCGYSCMKNTLKKANFIHIKDYLCFPNLDFVEEFIAPNSKFVEIPHYYNFLQKIAKCAGIYKYIHDAFIFICTKKRIEKNSLFLSIHARLSQKLHAKNIDLRLTRFDIRKRGALVLFVTNNITKNKFIIRVVPDETTNKIISKNHSFLQYLHSNKNIPFKIRSKIPLPIDAFKLNKNYIYIESLLPGILSWKANRNDQKNKIYQSIVDFIFEFNLATRKKATLNRELLDELFSEDLQLLNSSETIDNDFKIKLEKIIDLLKIYFLKKEMYLVCSHGDYGYGNILINPHNGDVTGVIDWDTGRKLEFPGIDIINLKIQLNRAGGTQSFIDSIKSIVLTMFDGGSIYEAKNHDNIFKIDPNYNRYIYYIALMRFIVRSSHYDEEFFAKQNIFKEALEYLIKNVAL